MKDVQRPTVAAAPAVSLQPEPRGGTFASLRIYSSLRWMWTGTLCTNTAFMMSQVAVGWLALELTGSALWVGLAAFAMGIPLLFLALPAGVIIDRVDRRTVLLLAQLGVLVFAGLFALLILTGLINRWLILPIGVGYGCSMSFVFPTRQTMIGQLVERKDLVNAVALNAAGQNATRIIGPALAGVLIAAIGLGGTFAFAAALQIIAMYTTLRLPSLKAVQGLVRGPLFRSFGEGLIYVRHDPVLLGTLLMATVCTIFLMPYTTLMPVFATEELGLGATGLGLIMAGIGLGSVAGTLLVAGLRGLATMRGIQVAGIGGFAVTVLIFAYTPYVLPAALLLFTSGVLSAFFLATNQTVLQVRADEAVRGRVMGVNMLTWGLLPVGQLPLGALADAIGAPAATAASSIVALILIAVIALRFAQLRGSVLLD
jgi:MFS family permease